MALTEERTVAHVCAVCDSPEQAVIFEQPLVVPKDRCTYSGFNIVACARCGFIYADRTLDQTHLDEHYGSATYKVAQELAALGEPANNLVRLRASVRHLVPHLRAESTVLDVGCGTGLLLDLLKQAGFHKTQGIDQSPTAVDVGHERYGVDIKAGSIFDLGIGEFDMVTACHVLEHITDVATFLSRIRALLAPGGLVYIEVPNAGDFERFADPRSVSDSIYISDLFTHFTPEHVNLFSVVSLGNLMRRYGFDEVECVGTPLGVIASLWRRAKHPASVVRDEVTPGVVARYAEQSRALQAKALDRIRELARTGDEVFVWGAGLHTQRLLANGGLGDVRIRGFADSDPIYRGASLAGKPIVRPDEIPPDTAVLISSYRAEQKIVDAARKMGLPNKLIRLYSE